jgi:hypothetical protein
LSEKLAFSLIILFLNNSLFFSSSSSSPFNVPNMVGAIVGQLEWHECERTVDGDIPVGRGSIGGELATHQLA